MIKYDFEFTRGDSVYLGQAYSTSNIELAMGHPIYYYDTKLNKM